MCGLASLLLVTALWLFVIPNLWAEIINFCDWIRLLIARKKRRKYLKAEYRKWYDKAKSCDNFGGAVDKGRAIAMLVIIKNELERDEKRQNYINVK